VGSPHQWHPDEVSADPVTRSIGQADPGLFGPDSVTWRVHADPSMALAGLRALLLQAVHPLAMAGVAQHSDFRGDPWGRLFRTAEYVAVVSYGTTAEATRAAARVRGIHRKLSGIEPESGTAYRVDDPELLLWVHCCEVESFLSTALRCGMRLTPAERDAYYAEQVTAAELVGIAPDVVPSTVEQMRRYFVDVQPHLRVTAEARRTAGFVLWPPMPSLCSSGHPPDPPGWRWRRLRAPCCRAGRDGSTRCPACPPPTRRPPRPASRSAPDCSRSRSGCARARTSSRRSSGSVSRRDTTRANDDGPARTRARAHRPVAPEQVGQLP
jgi:uncharacterized protein (DUF2236 family)